METIHGKIEAILKKANAAFDPTLVVSIISQIITAIRGCRSPERAKAQIREGGPVAFSQALRIARDEGYRGKEARELAADIVKQGVDMTDSELDDLITESRDLPQPPAAGGFWPMWAILLVLIPATLQAGEPTTKFWPIDEIQNKRLDDHDAALQKLQASIDSLRTMPRQVAPAPANQSILAIANNPRQAPWVETATGRTSDDHLIRAHGYTREQIAGLSQAQKDRLHGHAHEHPAPARAVQVARPVVQQSGCPGGVCPIRRGRGRWR